MAMNRKKIQLESKPASDYSSMALGVNGQTPIECYFYLQGAPTDSKVECFMDTIGCNTPLQILQNRWVGSESVSRTDICLSKITASQVNIGSCTCSYKNNCICHCIGSLCNIR